MSSFSPNPNLTPDPSSRKMKRNKQKKQKRRKVVRWLVGSLVTILVFVIALVTFSFATRWGRDARLMLAETVITTKHFRLAHLLTTQSEYLALAKALDQTPVNSGVPTNIHPVAASTTQSSPIDIEPISGNGWNGYVMLVHNPKLVRLVAAHVVKSKGEYITDMVSRTETLGGINASGFEDPNGAGWGGIPVGLVMIDGKVVQLPNRISANWTTVGFTKNGIMVMGNYSAKQLQTMGVRDAMQFHPELVVDGKPMITVGDGGWGYAPRTAIGQRKDGTVIFVVTNGRFHGGAQMGASQRQVMDVMLQYGAVNACAMDGGSSSVIDGNGQILNTPSTTDPNGERHLPNAWLVFPSEESADAYTPAGN